VTWARAHLPSGLMRTSSGGIAVGFVGIGEPGFADYFDDAAAVGAVVAERNEAGVGVDVDALGLRSKVGMNGATRGENQVGVAAFGGQPDEIDVDGSGVPFIELLDVTLAGSADGNDALAIRRKSEVAIVGGDAVSCSGFPLPSARIFQICPPSCVQVT